MAQYIGASTKPYRRRLGGGPKTSETPPCAASCYGQNELHSTVALIAKFGDSRTPDVGLPHRGCGRRCAEHERGLVFLGFGCSCFPPKSCSAIARTNSVTTSGASDYFFGVKKETIETRTWQELIGSESPAHLASFRPLRLRYSTASGDLQIGGVLVPSHPSRGLPQTYLISVVEVLVSLLDAMFIGSSTSFPTSLSAPWRPRVIPGCTLCTISCRSSRFPKLSSALLQLLPELLGP
ncbi:hypothetical protein PC116_g17360 [Phytophthora cactorum]|nr:hypothetical protein PC114_g21002 [Phytophthora cactorum]KAG4234487.1 hypothetical protein PC116_g17360 [Phytophthora cactorum]